MTWNLGGLGLDKTLDYLEGVSRDRDHGLHHVLCFSLQELCAREVTPPGTAPSRNTRESAHWKLTFHRGPDEWRGVGVAVKKQEGVVWGGQWRGPSFIQQKLDIHGERWRVASAHLPCTARLLHTGELLETWEEILACEPGWTTLLGADLNETFQEAQGAGPAATTSRGRWSCRCSRQWDSISASLSRDAPATTRTTSL
jgi:hypothetical protein